MPRLRAHRPRWFTSSFWNLPDAVPESFWRTAKADARSIRAHRALLGLVGVLIAAASLWTAYAPLHGALKVLVVLVSAGLGAVVLVWLGSWAVAIPLALPRQLAEAMRQRDSVRETLEETRQEAKKTLEREREGAQARLQSEVKRLEERIAAEREAFDLKWTEAENLRGQLGEAELRERRKAALLLRSELSEILGKIESFTKDRVVPEGFAFPHADWDKYRPLIAEDFELYSICSQAYENVHHVNHVISWRRTNSSSKRIGMNQNDGLIELGASTGAALKAIETVLRDDLEDVTEAAIEEWGKQRDYWTSKIGAWGPLEPPEPRLAVDATLTQEEVGDALKTSAEGGEAFVKPVRVGLALVLTNSDTRQDMSLEFTLRILNDARKTVFHAHPESLDDLPLHLPRMATQKLQLTFLIMPSVLRHSYDVERHRYFPSKHLGLNVYDRVGGTHLSLPLRGQRETVRHQPD